MNEIPKIEQREQGPESRIEVFEGLDGARHAIEQMIDTGQDYLHFIGYENKEWEKLNTSWARQNIVPRKVAAGIKSTAIYYPTEVIKNTWMSTAGREHREAGLLPEGKQLPLRFYIYGNSTLFIEEQNADFRTLVVSDPNISNEMRKIFTRFSSGPKPIGHGSLEVNLIRHAEATSQDSDAPLSEQGKLQAEVAALRLLADTWSKGGGILKAYFSPVARAQETFEIINTVSQTVVSHAGEQSPIQLYSPRKRDTLRAAGVIGPLISKGIPYEETVNYWLNNPKVIAGKSPEDIYDVFKQFLISQARLAERLPPGGNIHQLGITHEVPLVALLNHVYPNQTLAELGGQIRNCESIDVRIDKDSTGIAKLHFREKEADLSLK